MRSSVHDSAAVLKRCLVSATVELYFCEERWVDFKILSYGSMTLGFVERDTFKMTSAVWVTFLKECLIFKLDLFCSVKHNLECIVLVCKRTLNRLYSWITFKHTFI